MAPKIPKHVAMDLISYCKRLEVYVYPFDRRQKSAYEFARQLNSPKLLALNPNFVIDFNYMEEEGPSKIIAEFTNGSKWIAAGEDRTAGDLRYEFFQRAEEAEDDAQGEEEDTPDKPTGKAAATAAKPAAGGKAPAKPAAKPAAAAAAPKKK